MHAAYRLRDAQTAAQAEVAEVRPVVAHGSCERPSKGKNDACRPKYAADNSE
jgi:hypothetical protein